MARAPGGAVHYRLEPWEADLTDAMDGSRSVPELIGLALRTNGDLDVTSVAELVSTLERGGFFEGHRIDVFALASERADVVPHWRRRLRRVLREQSIEWRNAHGFVDAAYRRVLRPAFRPAGVVAGVVLALGGLAAFVGLVAPGRFHLAPARPGTEFFVLWVLNLLIIGCHELGHAVVVVHKGRRVLGAGFRLYFGSPSFYVESSDALMLSRGWRIIQAFGGPAAELVVAAPAAIAVWAFPEMWGGSTLYKWVVLNYFVMWMNLIPMLELDGYWMLSDAIGVPDLRARSFQFLRRDLWWKLRRRERFGRGDVGLLLFGVFGIATTVGSLVLSYYFWERLFLPLLASMWHGGAGGRALLAVLAIFVVGPALAALVKVLRSRLEIVRTAWRRATFRFQQRWRVEAAELLDGSGAFGDLPVDVLSDLAGRVRLRTVRPGQAVVRQGEVANAYFIVRTGKLRVLEEDTASSSENEIGTLLRGDGFGEVGLVTDRPRQATVRAVTRTELFELDGSTFRRVLSGRAEVPAYVATLAAADELRELGCFRRLSRAQARSLLDWGMWCLVPPGSVLVAEGGAADAFYVIGSGRAEIVKDGARVGELSRGTWFGELALINSTTRAASVTALTPMRVFRLTRDGFERYVADAFRSGAVRTSTDGARGGAETQRAAADR